MDKHQVDMDIFQQKTHEVNTAHWLNDVLFSWNWWLILIVTVGFWVVWWLLIDRKRIMEILIYGFFVEALSTFADVFGWNFVFWSYPDNLLPMCTPLLPIDYTVLPVAYMLTYQYFSKWKSFIIASIVMGAVLAFIGEPFLKMIHFYETNKWKHVYSFPGYITMALLVKYIVERIKN